MDSILPGTSKRAGSPLDEDAIETLNADSLVNADSLAQFLLKKLSEQQRRHEISVENLIKQQLQQPRLKGPLSSPTANHQPHPAPLKLTEAASDDTLEDTITLPGHFHGAEPPTMPHMPKMSVINARQPTTDRRVERPKAAEIDEEIHEDEAPKRRRSLRSDVEEEFNNQPVPLRCVNVLVRSRAWEACTTLAILLNAVMISVQADWSIQHIGQVPPSEFRVSEVLFTTYFTLELLLRMVDERMSFWSWNSPNFSWNYFDSFIVASALFEEIVVTLLGGNMPNVSMMRIARLLRLVRILRVVRVMRFFRDLRVMIVGIIESMRPLFWCAVLLFMLMFCFSLVLLQVILDHFESATATSSTTAESLIDSQDDLLTRYGSLVKAVFTLYMCITGGIDWGEATTSLIGIDPVMGVLFAAYICFSVMCVLNVITCVFVDKANQFSKSDADMQAMEELINREKWMTNLREIFNSCESLHENGEIDFDEFEILIQDKKVQEFFKVMGLEVAPDNAMALFSMIDIESNGTVGLEEFVSGCSQFVGSARQLDIARVRHDFSELRQVVDECLEILKVNRAKETTANVAVVQNKRTTQILNAGSVVAPMGGSIASATGSLASSAWE